MEDPTFLLHRRYRNFFVADWPSRDVAIREIAAKMIQLAVSMRGFTSAIQGPFTSLPPRRRSSLHRHCNRLPTLPFTSPSCANFATESVPKRIATNSDLIIMFIQVSPFDWFADLYRNRPVRVAASTTRFCVLRHPYRWAGLN